MQRVAITADDILRLRHLLLESGIIGDQPVFPARLFGQVERATVFRVQAGDDLSRQHDAQEVAESADFEFDHEPHQTISTE